MARVCRFLVDGVEAVNIATGIYRLGLGWSPAVAGRRDTGLGGDSLFEEVEERVPVQVRGANLATVQAGVAALAEVMAQAGRFWADETGEAVTFEAGWDGSGVTGQALVLRPVGGGLVLPRNFIQQMENGSGAVVATVELRFVRRGLWLASEVTGTLAANANNTKAVNFIAISPLSNLPCAIRTEWALVSATAPTGELTWEVLLAEGKPGSLFLFTVENGDFATTPVPEVGAIGDEAVSVGTGGFDEVQIDTVLDLLPGVPRWHLFTKAKNAGATDGVVTFAQGSATRGRRRQIGSAIAPAGEVALLYGGVVTRAVDYSFVELAVTGATLLFDSILLVAADDSAMMQWLTIDESKGTVTVTVDPRGLTQFVPSVTINNAGGRLAAVSGDGYTEVTGGGVSLVAYGYRKDVARLHYVDDGDDPPTLAITAKRRVGRLTL
jgi:hypothetical protein